MACFLGLNMHDVEKSIIEDKWTKKHPCSVTYERLQGWFKDGDPDNVLPFYKECVEYEYNNINETMPFPLAFNYFYNERKYKVHDKLCLITALNLVKFSPSQIVMFVHNTQFLYSQCDGVFASLNLAYSNRRVKCVHCGILFVTGDNNKVSYNPSKVYVIDLGKNNQFFDTDLNKIRASLIA